MLTVALGHCFCLMVHDVVPLQQFIPRGMSGMGYGTTVVKQFSGRDGMRLNQTHLLMAHAAVVLGLVLCSEDLVNSKPELFIAFATKCGCVLLTPHCMDLTPTPPIILRGSQVGCILVFQYEGERPPMVYKRATDLLPNCAKCHKIRID